MSQQPDLQPEKPEQSTSEAKDTLKKPSLPQVLLSVLAAMFGVQNNANRERDFQKGSPADFIAIYVIVVIAFVIGMIVLVRSVISSVQ